MTGELTSTSCKGIAYCCRSRWDAVSSRLTPHTFMYSVDKFMSLSAPFPFSFALLGNKTRLFDGSMSGAG